jgi:hypothetical protein
MQREYQRVKCAAVRKDGRPCRAWAIVGSEPALCAVHAGRNAGKGAKKGNRNALKHGYYSKAVRARVAKENVEILQSGSLLGELVTGRIVLDELMAFFLRRDLGPAEKLAAVPLINTTIRTVVFAAKQVDYEAVDWDLVYDNLKEKWGEV